MAAVQVRDKECLNQGGFSGVESMVENSPGGELTDRTYGVREVKDSSGNWVEMP